MFLIFQNMNPYSIQFMTQEFPTYSLVHRTLSNHDQQASQTGDSPRVRDAMKCSAWRNYASRRRRRYPLLAKPATNCCQVDNIRIVRTRESLSPSLIGRNFKLKRRHTAIFDFSLADLAIRWLLARGWSCGQRCGQQKGTKTWLIALEPSNIYSKYVARLVQWRHKMLANVAT